jgi:membrane protease YdiL (CAAX protease family)
MVPEGFWSNRFHLDVLEDLAGLLGNVIILLTPLWFLKKTGWELIKRALRLPKMRYLGLGLLLPVVIATAVSSMQFLIARAQWAHQSASLSPPELDSFFVLAGLNLHSVFFFPLWALAEEITFRGLFLVLLTKRYGLHRGVFFTGLIWAAAHFPSDSYAGLSVAAALLHVANRIAICLLMNYVLAWMAMRWNSVLPAACAHAVSNILVVGGVNSRSDNGEYFLVLCWTVTSYLLWRYWPIVEPIAFGEDVHSTISLTNSEPAAL